MADTLWRFMLWMRHGCPVDQLYGDDGEMQCSRCGIDFGRWTPEAIDARFIRLGEQKLASVTTPPPSLPEGTER